MKNLAALFVLFLSFSLAVQAQNGPVMTFKTDTYDFGTITEGDSVSFEFVFTNTGKSNLIISNVQASCGCTTPYWPQQPIKPGESSKIKATFKSEGKMGTQNKVITITTNEADNTKRVFFKGLVKERK
ncbi:MAG: DUF1573 domain-containing protein [Chitinophagales bacterium]|nr:DUF1573 domain-containing protein [Chitinophagales bacterium]